MATRKTTVRKSKSTATKPVMAGHQQKPSSIFLEWGDKVPDPRRIGRQTQQELNSKSALVSWLHKHAWISNIPEPDLGQDFRTEIYERGRSTGLSLNIQHKSAKNIDSYKLKTTPHLSYPIEVKDLLHWRKQAVPVFLFVCDVRLKKERFWLNISDAIDELARNGSAWTRKEKVKVKIPICNRLDADALPKIRRLLADHFYPTFARRYKELKIGANFCFPATPEGQKKRTAFTRLLDTGQKVTIEKEYIADFRLSDWYEQLYGRQVPDSLTIASSRSRQTYRYRMEVLSRDGSVVPAQSLELRVLRSGRYEATLSNKHQEGPLIFNVKMLNYPGRQTVQVAFKLVHAGNTVFETRDALLFVLALAEGGQIQLIETSSGKAMPSGPVAVNKQFPLARTKAQAELIRKLCFLQSRFQFSPALTVRGRSLTQDDFYRTNQLYTICQTGRYSSLQEFSFIINIASLRAQEHLWKRALSTPLKQGLEMHITGSENITVLGQTIELGSAQHCAKFTIEQTRSYLEQVKYGFDNNLATIKTSMSDVMIEFTYLDWKPDDGFFGFNLAPKRKNRTRLSSGQHEATTD